MSAPDYWKTSPGPGPAPASAAPPPEPAAPASPLQRFLGGPPLAVFLRLVVVSLVVGALLVWLDIRPFEVFVWFQRFINRLWMLGWDAVREIAEYLLAGAAIVVPVWLVLRLFNMRPAK